MPVAGILAIILGLALATLVFSTLTYSLRNLTRLRLADYLDRHKKSAWLTRTMDRLDDLVLVTAVWRMLAITVLILACFAVIALPLGHGWLAYLVAAILASIITFFCGVAFPHSLAACASTEMVGFFIRPLHWLRLLMVPAMGLMRGIDNLVRNATGFPDIPEAEEIEQEILSAVEEGQKEGVVNEQEREMIESVIEFRDTNAGKIMTSRPEIVAIELHASLDEIKRVLEESGHSRIPVYMETLDQVVGILYARDLLRYVGSAAPQAFDIKAAMRPAYYVPETKPLRDLLRDFRLQKLQMAIVLDEYGGTAGLVTVENILEELVGEISDEHEGVAPMFHRFSDTAAEADARIEIEELNRLTGLNLPEDAGYTTLGGFISTTLGRIPEPNTVFEHNGTRFIILAAEPQRIDRVRIEQVSANASLAPSPDAA